MTQEFNQGDAEAAQQPLSYVPPMFECHPLRLITLGGTPGRGDTGNPGNEDPGPGNRAPDSVDYDDGFRDDDDPWG